MTQPTISVANYFIAKAIDSGAEITPMKLIKLVYIAHGWHLAFRGQPLIGEAVEAWKFGPVIDSIYQNFKEFKNSQITRQKTYLGPGGQLVVPQVSDADTQIFLDRVWVSYRRYNGLQLSAMTHQPDTRWDTIWKKNGGAEMRGAVIPNDLIEQHYKHLAATRPANTSSAS